MIGIALLVLVLVVVAAAGFFVVKNIGKLIINSILGLLVLFLVNYFDIMALAGKPDIEINLISFLICALAGLPGALLMHSSSRSSGSRYSMIVKPLPAR